MFWLGRLDYRSNQGLLVVLPIFLLVFKQTLKKFRIVLSLQKTCDYRTELPYILHPVSPINILHSMIHLV